jgi:hypothetical protein
VTLLTKEALVTVVDTGPGAIRPWIAGDLRPGEIWCNVHTGEETRLTTFTSRVERLPDPRGGFRDDPQLVVHHTSNVPPGFKWGYGDDLASFLEHWQPKRLYKQTVTKSADLPITEERPRDVGAPGAAT